MDCTRLFSKPAVRGPQGVEDQRFYRLLTVRLRPAQADGENHFLQIGLEAAGRGQVLTEPGVDERLSQGRARAFDEDLGEDFMGDEGKRCP